MIDTRTHAILDYVTGALLIVAPYILGFATGGIEQLLPQVLGAMTIVMSLLTQYELSAAKVIPLKVHLGVDVIGGALLALMIHSCGQPTRSRAEGTLERSDRPGASALESGESR